VGSGGGAGKSTLEAIHVTSRMSKASPLLLARLATGEHVQSAGLTFRKSGKDQVDFLTLNLDDVRVDSYRVTTAADGTPVEEYTLVFDRADLAYRPQNPDGTLGAAVAFTENGLGVEHFEAPQQSLIHQAFATNTNDDYFLTVDGIPGESRDAKHKDAIDVLAFGWGGNAEESTGGGGAGTGKTAFHEFHFLAPVSKASPKLLDAMASGLHVKDAVLTAVRSGATQLEFLKTELSDVQVSSYQVVMGAQGQLLEEFTLRFADAQVDYTAQSLSGGAAGVTSFTAQAPAEQEFSPPQRSLIAADNVQTPTGLSTLLQIDGVQGESTDAKHKGAIDVLSFSWGGDSVAAVSTGGGAGVGKTSLQELHVVSRFSKASPSILELLDSGRHSEHASLVVRKSSKDQVEFYTINLDDVIVSSYQVTTAQDGTLLEEYTLAFDKATQEYRPQNADGSLGAAVAFTENGMAVDGFRPVEHSILRDGFVAPTGTNLFLDVDGIAGESRDAKHKDQIDVLAFSWGGDAVPGSTSGGGAGVGKTVYQQLHIVSRVSKASPSLLARLLSGQHTKDAVLTVRQSSTGNEVLTIRLSDVQVSSYQVTTALDGTLTEEFTLSFGPGGVTGAPVADAGGPYSVGDGQSVTLDASGTSDPDDDPAALTYQWDLDGDGVFGETGAGAARGDEVGVNPVFSAAGLFGPQTFTVTLKVTDPAGHVSTDTATVTIVDVTPPDTTITAGPPALTNQTSATFTFTGSDQGTPANLLTFSADLDGGPRFAVTSPLTLTNLADGVHTLRVYAKDQAGNEDATPAVYTWKVDTVGPSALNLVSSPNAVPVGSPATLTATISDLLTGASAVAAAQYSLDGGTTWQPMTATDGAFDSAEEAVRGTITPLPAGVYTVLVRGVDAAGNTGAASSLTLPVFDRDAGFVTGGGQFESPAGADPAHPTRTGRAKLEVEAKYGRKGDRPEGEVHFSSGDLNFRSTELDWMVITGSTARLAGAGTINGRGDYAFELTFVDGKLGKGSGGDLVRIRITDRATGRVIYDNGAGLAPTAPPASKLLDGNLKIHKGDKDDR
jgi:type VI secretion system Hcp family effector